MQKNLVSNRYKYPVSDQELSRRLEGVQKLLREDGLDALVTQTSNPIFDKGIRYFLDTQTGGYSTCLIIPAEGKMTVLQHGNDADSMPVPASMRNVEKVIPKPYCPPFSFTDDMCGEVIAQELKAKGYKKIGLYNYQTISLGFGDAIRAAMPDAEIVKYSDRIYEFTAIKSEEEWELIDKALNAHDQLMHVVPSLIRPGMMEFEIRNQICHLALNMGCDTIGNVAVGSCPKGGLSMFTPHFSENRRIEDGDTVTVMIEVAGPGGMFCELARTFCLGKPNDSLLELYDIALGAQTAVAKAAVPGITGAELTEVFDNYVTQYGIEPNARFVGHGQGYDMMESPAICSGETMKLQENMYFAIHPELIRGTDFATCCDNFRITKDGAVRVTKFEQKIFELEF